MDPCRIRSYLQVACAGLGFEIGEIWWTSNEHGSSTVAAIEEKPAQNVNADGTMVASGGNNQQQQRKLRFVQLYTSKSYENRRSMLVTPPEDGEDDEDFDQQQQQNGFNDQQDDHHHGHHHDHECTTKDLEKHKLSPRLVDAISKTAQVVWANTVKQEGLTGRSDIPLHTAVGMPVALDASGNMCVVVMFSPSNIQSTDEAMEYLQSISRSATSSSIPCLMPAFDNTEEIMHVPTVRDGAIKGHIMPQVTSLGEGVTARFVSIDDDNNNNKSGSSTPEEIRGHNLATAPKDCFGIPMLPSFAELGGENSNTNNNNRNVQALTNGKSTSSTGFEDVFDEASYGVWSTIMQDRPQLSATQSNTNTNQKDDEGMEEVDDTGIPRGLNEGTGGNPAEDDYIDPKSLVATHNKRTIDPKRKEQLEEFCSAFLGMSVFDVADVWIPAGPEQPDCLSHVTTITAGSNQSNAINEFKRVSGYTLIKFWSGAVGRAYSSGNPVWSCNPDVYIDKGREKVFEKANIMTAFAVPILSGKRATPVGVVCCYSMIQSGSVPFVLRFVQQALHLLWSGLDKVEPHESVGQEMWQDVGPADLGEMAADVEMQHHFISKKRPRSMSVDEFAQAPEPDEPEPLSEQFNSIDFDIGRDRAISFSNFIPVEEGSEEPIQEFYTYEPQAQPEPQQQQHQQPIQVQQEPPRPVHYQQQQQQQQQLHRPSQQMSVQAMHAFQNHIKEAVRQVGEALPFTHTHLATTADGSKRAHIAHPTTGQQPATSQTFKRKVSHPPAPLPMPHALPTHVMKSSHHAHRNDHGESIDMQNQTSHHMMPSNQPQNQVPPQQNQIQHPPQFMQQTSVASNHQSTSPSQLSQNLLGKGMLHNIASQQYQFDNNDIEPTPFTPSVPHYQNQGQAPHSQPQYGAPLAPASHGMSAPPAVTNGTYPQQQQHHQQQPLQNNNDYCMPTDTGHVAPDLHYSAQVDSVGALEDEGGGGGGGKVKCCRIQGCDEPAVLRRPYCASHSGNRLCEHDGCNKCAQGSTRFCIAHGGGRRCTFPGCDKGARDKFFCAAHGGGKRCKADGCNKSAVGGSSLCTAHGGGRRCAVDGCDKSAQSSTKFCVKHGGGKKCSHEGCEKVARGRTQYCAAHGGGVRCKLEGCNRVAIGKMQLCRAHGGGSRARTKASAKIPTPPPMAAGAPMYATPTMQQQQQQQQQQGGGYENSTNTSV